MKTDEYYRKMTIAAGNFRKRWEKTKTDYDREKVVDTLVSRIDEIEMEEKEAEGNNVDTGYWRR